MASIRKKIYQHQSTMCTGVSQDVVFLLRLRIFHHIIFSVMHSFIQLSIHS